MKWFNPFLCLIVETPPLHLENEVSNRILFIFKRKQKQAYIYISPLCQDLNARVNCLWTLSVFVVINKRLSLGFLVKTLKMYARSFYKHTYRRRHVVHEVNPMSLPEFLVPNCQDFQDENLANICGILVKVMNMHIYHIIV